MYIVIHQNCVSCVVKMLFIESRVFESMMELWGRFYHCEINVPFIRFNSHIDLYAVNVGKTHLSSIMISWHELVLQNVLDSVSHCEILTAVALQGSNFKYGLIPFNSEKPGRKMYLLTSAVS